MGGQVQGAQAPFRAVACGRVVAANGRAKKQQAPAYEARHMWGTSYAVCRPAMIKSVLDITWAVLYPFV